MALEGQNQDRIAMKADAAMTNANRVVMLDTSAARTVKAPTANTDVPFGVIKQTASAAGIQLEVVTRGRVKICAAAAITRGSYVQINGTGGKVKTLVGTGYQVGVALDSVTTDGDLVEVDVNILGIPKA